MEISLWHHAHRVHGPGVLGAFFVLVAVAALALQAGRETAGQPFLKLGAIMAVAMLSYTASVVQLGIHVALLVALLALARDPRTRARWRLAAGGFALGAAIALALYYGPYAVQAVRSSQAILERQTYDPPASFFFLRNQMRDTVRILLNGYPLYVGLSILGLIELRRKRIGSGFQARLLCAAALALGTVLVLKDPALLPRVFVYAKEDLFYAPVAAVLAAVPLAGAWRSVRGRIPAALALGAFTLLQVRDQALGANTLRDQPVDAGVRRDGAAAPANDAPAGRQPAPVTRAEISLLDSAFEGESRTLKARVRLLNRGETAWYPSEDDAGWVTIALRTDPRRAPDFCEALPRHRLTAPVPPGGEVVRELEFFLPRHCPQEIWHLDLVNEGYYWFSDRGTTPAEVRLR
jgi:hypothetical protein